MYSVKIYEGPTDQEGILIHSPYVNGLKVDGQMDLLKEGVSSFDFTINPKNPAWGNIKNLTTLIKITNIKTNRVVFDGFVLKPTDNMSSSGAFTTKYTCDSKLAYLNDSHQRYAKFQDTTIKDFFAYLIEKHNSQVEEHKRFKPGIVTVSNPTDNVYRFVGYENTYDEIQDNLIDRLGGFLVLREESDGTYIDYLEEVGEQETTPIRLRTNLQGMKRDIDPTEIITRVIPLGAREEGETADASQPRLDITSVNGGIDYLEDVDLVAEFGVVEGTIVLDDVNTASTLMLRGEQFFASQSAARVSYDITALNLYLIDDEFENFEVGNWYPVENPVFNVDESLQIIAMRINLKDPQKDQLTIGEKYRTLTEYQVESNKKSRKIVELENSQERQSKRISVLNNELQAVGNAVQEVQLTLSENDLPALEDAVDNLNEAINNLNESLDNIPIYDLATLSDPGLMSVEDKTKLERITVNEPINLTWFEAHVKERLDALDGGVDESDY